MSTVDLTVPVSAATAERWRDATERTRLGALLSVLSTPGATEAEIVEAVHLFAASPTQRRHALADAVGELRRASAEAGVTADEIDAELAAWKRERVAARRNP